MVSEYFIPIYETLFTNKKNISSLQEANMIFCETEFIDWLKNKFPKKITSTTYPKYCSLKYLKLFFFEFNKLIKKKKSIAKIATILQLITSEEKFPPTIKNEYDVDIVETYFKIKLLLESNNANEEIKERHIGNALHPIRFYCTKKQMSVAKVLDMQYPIIVESDIYNFEAYLGCALIVSDVNKINLILNYHLKGWKRKGSFILFAESVAYRFVLKNSPYSNNERLAKIADWVEKKKDMQEASQRTSYRKHAQKLDSTLSEGSASKEVSPSFTLTGLEEDKKYFITQSKKFAVFFKELKLSKFISANTELDAFKNIFSEKTIRPNNRVNWTGSNIELNLFISLLMGDQKKIKKIKFKWETTIKVFIKDGKDLSVEQLSKSNGKKTSEDKLKAIISLL